MKNMIYFVIVLLQLKVVCPCFEWPLSYISSYFSILLARSWAATLASGAAVSAFAEEATQRVQASFKREINQEPFEFPAFDPKQKIAKDVNSFFENW